MLPSGTAARILYVLQIPKCSFSFITASLVLQCEQLSRIHFMLTYKATHCGLYATELYVIRP